MTLARWLPRFRRAYSALARLREHESLPRPDIARLQLDRLNAVWHHAVRHVPHYRELASRGGTPMTFQSLEEYSATVPLLEKAAVRDQPRRLLSDRAGRGFWAATSGSTGASTRVFWTRRAHCEALHARYRHLAMWGVDIFDRSVLVWGDRTPFMGQATRLAVRIRRRVEDSLRNRLRLSANRLDRDSLRRYLDRMRRFQPVVMYAYSTAAYLLAREALATGVRCPSLALIVLGAEVVRPHMVETIERAFRVPAIVDYGSIECGFIAGEHPDRTLRVRDDAVFLETRARADGRFDVVVSVLNNPAFPLLRYAIGDTADGPLDTSRGGFGVLRSIGGRRNDLLVTDAGVLVHPSHVCHLFEDDAAIRRFRAHQSADGSLHAVVEPGEPVAPDLRRLRERLRALLGFGVTVELVDELPQPESGKHRWLVSDAVDSGTVSRHDAP
jgi:phenylacetate-CoA ligase